VTAANASELNVMSLPKLPMGRRSERLIGPNLDEWVADATGYFVPTSDR
jgi:hypothetical protein